MGWAIAKSARRRLAAAVAGGLVAVSIATPAAAEDPVIPPEASQLAIEGVDKLIRALELFMQSIPAYGEPYVDDDGNIVIPRLDDPAAPAPLEPPVEETGTTT